MNYYEKNMHKYKNLINNYLKMNIYLYKRELQYKKFKI